MCVCVWGGHWMGEAEWASQWSFHVELQTFRGEKKKMPRALSAAAALLQVSANQGGDQWAKTNQGKCVGFRIWWETLTSTSNFQQRTEKWARRPAPSACWVKKINNNNKIKKGAVVSEGHEGLANRRDYTVSQSTTCSLSDANWQRHNTSGSTESRRVRTVCQRGRAERPSAVKGSKVFSPTTALLHMGAKNI